MFKYDQLLIEAEILSFVFYLWIGKTLQCVVLLIT